MRTDLGEGEEDEVEKNVSITAVQVENALRNSYFILNKRSTFLKLRIFSFLTKNKN